MESLRAKSASSSSDRKRKQVALWLADTGTITNAPSESSSSSSSEITPRHSKTRALARLSRQTMQETPESVVAAPGAPHSPTSVMSTSTTHRVATLRSKKSRYSNKMDYCDDSDDEWLPPQAARSAQSRKRPQSIKEKKEPITMHHDVLLHIMSYLSPKPLQAFANSSRALQASITTDMVVKSAMVQGGQGQKLIDAIRRLMTKQSIHPPSPKRLLKLVNCATAGRCEECGHYYGLYECWMNVRAFGLFCCERCCLQECQHIAKYNHKTFHTNPKYNRIARFWANERISQSVSVSTARANGRIVVTVTTVEAVIDGEVAGPVVNSKNMRNALVRVPWYPNMSVPDLVDKYLLGDCPGPEAYQAFLSAVEEGTILAEAANEFRKLQRKQASLKSAQNRFSNFREEVIGKIKPKLGEQWREVALNCTVNEETFSVTMDCPFVHSLLKGSIRAPTKVESKTVEAFATSINTSFAAMFDHNFIDFAFAWNGDDGEEPCSNALALQAKVVPLFQEAFPDLLSILPRLTDDVVETIKKGKLVDAMLDIGEDIYFSNDLGKKLLLDVTDDASEEDKSLARAVWLWAWKKCNSEFYGMKKHHKRLFLLKTYSLAITHLIPMRQIIVTYLDWVDATSAFDEVYYGFPEHARATVYESSLFDYFKQGDFRNARSHQLHLAAS